MARSITQLTDDESGVPMWLYSGSIRLRVAGVLSRASRLRPGDWVTTFAND